MSIRVDALLVPFLSSTALVQEPVTTLIDPDSQPHQVPLSELVFHAGGGELVCPDPHYPPEKIRPSLGFRR